ncbi:hypothetical protein HYG86_00025 [Alkalicella caledoniensis]|uniref:Uncharacterized protein n=1 Tax=Alkalicella caledoniensis TaxID=2731377 RepID=A0A7G9W3L6_ALKCA|nr:hypothetical protein [Alkalicella caledoniensis]QNO13278.1 hypothetical protein HYG86_00025 [Alkalicella caledoniensis]
MEKMLNLILDELRGIKKDVESLKEGQVNLEQRLDKLELGQVNLEERLDKLDQGQEGIARKLDVVYKQTADLVEFRTETQVCFQDLKDDIDFLTTKETKNEKDIFLMKQKRA